MITSCTNPLWAHRRLHDLWPLSGEIFRAWSYRSDVSTTNTKKFTGTPIIVRTGLKTDLKAAIGWRGGLERSPVSKHLFWATASLCIWRWKVGELTVAGWRRLWVYVAWHLLHRTDAHILWQPVQKTQRVLFAELAPQKQQKKEKQAGWSGDVCSLPSSIVSVSITLHVSQTQWIRDMADSFMLMRSSLGRGGREEGLGVFEADKNGNAPLAAHHLGIKASCWSLGSQEGEERMERGGERGRCPSCVWQVSGLSCVVWCSETIWSRCPGQHVSQLWHQDICVRKVQQRRLKRHKNPVSLSGGGNGELESNQCLWD